MRFLYLFPHPDDESFGPVAAMHQQLKQGHEVHLLTLTKGGATKVRYELGLTIEQMGEVRYKEMQAVAKTLGLTSMEVWDMPDSGLKRMDPREIAVPIEKYIKELKPDIVVTYPVHGISGFHDHLIIHAVVKRLYLDMVSAGEAYLKRLAFFTLPDKEGPKVGNKDFSLKKSDEEDIDVEVGLKPDDIEMLKKCLSCYKTYQDKIESIGVVEQIGETMYFEIFGEEHKPRLNDLADKLS